jgi:hypothetical protein
MGIQRHFLQGTAPAKSKKAAFGLNRIWSGLDHCHSNRPQDSLSPPRWANVHHRAWGGTAHMNLTVLQLPHTYTAIC